MPGLSFDDGPAVDPHLRLGGLFVEWVDVLATRRAAKTVKGYVSDAGVVAAELLDVVGRPAPAELGDPAALAGYPGYPANLRRPSGPIVPVQVYARAHLLVGALELVDLHPRLLGRAFDRLGTGRAPATQRRVAAAWSSLCGLLVRRGLLAANPMLAGVVERPPAPKDLPKPLDVDEVEALLTTLAEPDDRARAPWPARDLALAAVFLATGVRLDEAVSACVGDLTAASGAPLLRVLGKGGKTRVLPVHDEAHRAVLGYLDDRRARFGAFTGAEPLFVRADGRPFTPRSAEGLVERWYVRAGVRRRRGACVHALRHTFATLALDSGASVVEVQQLLGHASLETSRKYLAVVGEGLRDATNAHATRSLMRRLRTTDAAGESAAHPR